MSSKPMRIAACFLSTALALALWASSLPSSFVSPVRLPSTATLGTRRAPEGLSQAKDSASIVLGGMAMALAIGFAGTRPQPGRQVIVRLRAEAEATEEESADAEEEVAEEDDEEGEEGEEGDAEEKKPSKWKCLDCGSLNFAASTECEKCGAAKPSPEESELVEARDQAKDEVAKVMDGFLRMQADLQNYRRQHDEAMARAKDLGKLDALKKLLPINDDIETAIMEPEGMDDKDKAIFDSYSLLFRKVGDVWTKCGVTTMEASVGEKYDEGSHDLVEEREPGDGEAAGTIVDVVKSGYLCDGKVVIPSQVVVASAEGPQEEATEETEEEHEEAEATA
mmetsp:Transcript_35530/g.66186  ORF Transcript_35530/g.66186 Transcript_35530/m.66186 type:complete len:337 (+) Transcript_35530:66-1076(+)